MTIFKQDILTQKLKESPYKSQQITTFKQGYLTQKLNKSPYKSQQITTFKQECVSFCIVALMIS